MFTGVHEVMRVITVLGACNDKLSARKFGENAMKLEGSMYFTYVYIKCLQISVVSPEYYRFFFNKYRNK